jgi:demethylmenaquinone methyltransferase/2-methoxy-6-polyprenyl-1,4-benzoquinol methylase
MTLEERSPAPEGHAHRSAATGIPRPSEPRSVERRASRAGNEVDPAEVARMFGVIAPVYDRLNTVMTVGSDGRWRAAAAAATGVRSGGSALDVACGTGKLTAVLARRVGPFGRIVGLDVTPEMLALARHAHGDLMQVSFVQGDALALPFEPASFDAATIAFGLRNLADFEAGFREMARVVRPGGRVVCLELSLPRPRWWGWLFHATFRRVAPVLGSLVGARSAYGYLPASLDGFPRADRLAASMRAAGLSAVRYRRYGLGTVALHVGTVPDGSGSAARG